MLRDQKIAERDAMLAEKDKALLGFAKALKLSRKSYGEISVLTTLPVNILQANLK